MASKYSRIKVISVSNNSKLIIFFELLEGMAKYTKVYMRNKKESNISLPLRYSFLRSIFVQNMSVKNAASKWKIHYSSAKIIARTARRNKLYILFDKESPKPAPIIQCTFKSIDESDSNIKINQEDRQEENSNNGSCQTHFSQQNSSKIQIRSTIGWTFNFHFLEQTL